MTGYPIFFVDGFAAGTWKTWLGGNWYRWNYVTERYDITVDRIEYGPFGACWPVLKATLSGIVTR